MHGVRVRQAQSAPRVDQEVVVGRGDVDRRRLGGDTLGCLLDPERRSPAQDLRHEARVPRVEVLDDDHGDREVSRQGAQHRADGRQPPGGSRHEDDVVPPGGREERPAGLIFRNRLGHREPLSDHGDLEHHAR